MSILDLFRTPDPKRLKARHLALARLQLAEVEIAVEDYIATREKLKARIERLDAELSEPGAAEELQQLAAVLKSAPNPGPRREKVGGFAVPDPIMRGHKATLA